MLNNHTQKVIIIDYGMGNLRSVQKKFSKNEIPAIITSEIGEISKATKLILPGVGHFAKGIKKLKETGIWDVLNMKVLSEKVPILGICLGMQLMTKYSEEGDVEGLGWFDAKVIRFKIEDTINYKVPHMGWNSVVPTRKHQIFNDVNENSLFYFAHSYHVECNKKKDILTETAYEYKFVSAIQFHPEKSHDQGEQVINNFVQI